MGNFARKFLPYYQDISSDIFKFCQALGIKPTFQQKQLFEAVQKGDTKIAVKSGQGPGKTRSSVVVGLWRTLRNVDALTIVTAPTMRQCKDVWLVEAARVLETADPQLRRFIDITKTRLSIAGRDDWGVKLVTANKEENAQGYHQQNMTVIVEEASGVPREIITQFKGTLSNPNSLLLEIGNPNLRDCAFFDSFTTQRADWTCLTWNAEETPESPWFSQKRNHDLAKEFGRDSDVYRIRVLGEFPLSDPNCVIGAEELEKRTDKALIYKAILANYGCKQIGTDFSRYGGDESTVFRRSGNAIVEWERHSHTDPSVVVDLSFKMQAAAHWTNDECLYISDAGGMGQGIMHRYYEASKRIVEFHNNGVASDNEFENKITEAWFGVARLIRDPAVASYIPRDPQLLQQLSTRQYYTTRKGKLILESKDEYMKRGNNSPDRADGLVMAMYDGALAKTVSSNQSNQRQMLGAKVRNR